MGPCDDLAVLRRGLEPLADLLRQVDAEARDCSTPWERWTVRGLVDHVVAMPTKFAPMVSGEPIDWSAPTPSAGDNPAQAFRSHADELLGAWREHPHDSPANAGLDWQCAELAVHTWDLATALRRQTGV